MTHDVWYFTRSLRNAAIIFPARWPTTTAGASYRFLIFSFLLLVFFAFCLFFCVCFFRFCLFIFCSFVFCFRFLVLLFFLFGSFFLFFFLYFYFSFFFPVFSVFLFSCIFCPAIFRVASPLSFCAPLPSQEEAKKYIIAACRSSFPQSDDLWYHTPRIHAGARGWSTDD